MDPTAFVTDFPEFANASAYPTATIQLWLSVATNLLDPIQWGALLTIGTELFVAHNLALSAQAQKAAAMGGVPGQSSGPLAAKAVDKVSAAYDVGAVALDGGGEWNATSYGRRYLGLARLIGAGGVQL